MRNSHKIILTFFLNLIASYSCIGQFSKDCEECQNAIGLGIGSGYSHLVDKLNRKQMELNETVQLQYCIVTCLVERCSRICSMSAEDTNQLLLSREPLISSIKQLGGEPIDCNCSGISIRANSVGNQVNGTLSQTSFSPSNGNSSLTKDRSIQEKIALLEDASKKQPLKSSFTIEDVVPATQKNLVFDNSEEKMRSRFNSRRDSILNVRANDKQRKQQNIEKSIEKSTSNKNCDEDIASEYLIGYGLSNEICEFSLNKSVYWSEWILVKNTSLMISFSKKKKCEEPEFPGTTNSMKNLKFILDAADQFFDYGFFRLKNTSENATISGHFSYRSKKNKGGFEEGTEPIYLQPGQVDQGLGNWYQGCELLQVTINDLCSQID